MKSARKYCPEPIHPDPKRIHAHQVCALIDFVSGGEQYIANALDPRRDAELMEASAVTGLPIETLSKGLISLGNPFFKFDAGLWPTSKAMTMSPLTDTDRFILSCRLGVALIPARAYVFQLKGVNADPSKWIPALKQLCSHLDTQVQHFVTQLQAMSDELEPKEDIFTKHVCRSKGISGLMSELPEIKHLSKMNEHYKTAIRQQENDEVQSAKLNGTSPKSVLENK